MTDVVVDLTPSEIGHGLRVGAGRQLAALRQGRTPHLAHDGTFYAHLCGALGELAVAKWLGIYWSPNVGGSDNHDGDVGRYQVRATPHRTGKLIIHDLDDDDAVFVLVTGEPPRLTLRGWLYAAEGKVESYLGSPNGWTPDYFVPQSALRGMSDLPVLVP